MKSAISNITICGQGLAFEVTIAALLNSLPEYINIHAVNMGNSEQTDLFYGSVASPTAYDFHLSLGLDEPHIVAKTNTSFALGSHYYNWAKGLEWVQCHNLPFPVWKGCEFQHYLRRINRPLQPYLIGAICGQNNKFAHPPQDRQIPLSNAEYGYQFSARSLTELLRSSNKQKNLKRYNSSISEMEIETGHIKSISLKQGEKINADFYIDCSGPTGLLMTSLGNSFQQTRKLNLIESHDIGKNKASTLRKICGTDYGWYSDTSLQDAQIRLTICHPDDTDKALSDHQNFEISNEFNMAAGRRKIAWQGNVVAIGHAGHVLEPLTSAPYLLLQKDIERLLLLLPHTENMRIEAKEYNRLWLSDLKHAEMFHKALFATDIENPGSYWKEMAAWPCSDKLRRKIKQFESRGLICNYDHEPYNNEDWLILHFGMKRQTERYDRFADALSDKELHARLDHIENRIKVFSQKLPPSDRYIQSFKRYLEKKHGPKAGTH